MSDQIEYNGFTIKSTTRQMDPSSDWTVQVRITPADSDADVRRCRSPNTYPSKAEAVTRSLAFGRRVIDGTARPKVDPAK
ncbi:MAG TPA: hypothetical protein VGA37_16105 [Gemmatimonadales bacterium]